MKKIKKALVTGADRELYGKIKQMFVKGGYEVSAAPAARQAVVKELNEKQDVIVMICPDRTGLAIQTSYGKKSDKTTVVPVFAVIQADDYNPAVIFDAPRWGLGEAAGVKPAEVKFVMNETEKILNSGLDGYFVLFAGYHSAPAAAAVPALKKTA